MLPSLSVDLDRNNSEITVYPWEVYVCVHVCVCVCVCVHVYVCVYSGIHGKLGAIGKIQEYIVQEPLGCDRKSTQIGLS